MPRRCCARSPARRSCAPSARSTCVLRAAAIARRSKRCYSAWVPTNSSPSPANATSPKQRANIAKPNTSLPPTRCASCRPAYPESRGVPRLWAPPLLRGQYTDKAAGADREHSRLPRGPRLTCFLHWFAVDLHTAAGDQSFRRAFTFGEARFDEKLGDALAIAQLDLGKVFGRYLFALNGAFEKLARHRSSLRAVIARDDLFGKALLLVHRLRAPSRNVGAELRGVGRGSEGGVSRVRRQQLVGDLHQLFKLFRSWFGDAHVVAQRFAHLLLAVEPHEQRHGRADLRQLSQLALKVVSA